MSHSNSINAESDLAGMLYPFLERPCEAKVVLQNVFKASGSIRVTYSNVTVALDVIGNADEHYAFKRFFKRVNTLKLSLPGDVKGRPLRFRPQIR